jgi:uncharacterized protein YaaW (UPF0174 family)
MPSELELRPSQGIERPSGWQTAFNDDPIVISGTGPLPLIEDDHDLVPLLRQASNEELAPLVEYILKKGRATAQLDRTQTYKLHSPNGNHRAYADDIAAEIQKFGANTMWSHLFRKGRGKKYRKILKDVARRCGIKASFWDETGQIEDRVVLAVLGRAYESMTEAQRRELLNTLEIHRIPGTGALAGAAGLEVAIWSTGFVPYKAAVIVANGTANAVLGHGLAFAANAGLTKGMALFAGPIGLAFDALVGGAILAGPAYRVTIPCVVQVALIRKAMRQRRRVRFRRVLFRLLMAAFGTVLAVVIGRWLGTWLATLR